MAWVGFVHGKEEISGMHTATKDVLFASLNCLFMSSTILIFKVLQSWGLESLKKASTKLGSGWLSSSLLFVINPFDIKVRPVLQLV